MTSKGKYDLKLHTFGTLRFKKAAMYIDKSNKINQL